MTDKTILIIEDDGTIQNFLRLAIKSKGHKAIIAEEGLTGIALFMSHNPDMVLLDLGLPDIDGLEVLEQLRKTSDIPIIIISARGQENEKVLALDMGADDYITKPFNIEELFARIRVALRRYKPQEIRENIFKLDVLCVNFEKRQVFVNNTLVHFTPIEYKMLLLLIENKGKVITHHFIQNEVWGFNTTDDFQTLRVFMASIRRKLEDDTTNPRFIMTEIGVGYRFADE